MNLRLLFTLKMLYYFRLKQRKIAMKKITTLILLSFLASISFSNATEFNENSLYSNQVESAYNQVDLPLLPGSWKIYDLEKSGSVASGNFYVYATLVPEILQPGDNSLNFDGITLYFYNAICVNIIPFTLNVSSCYNKTLPARTFDYHGYLEFLTAC